MQGALLTPGDLVSHDTTLKLQFEMVVALLASWLSCATPLLFRKDSEELLEMYLHYLHDVQRVLKHDSDGEVTMCPTAGEIEQRRQNVLTFL